MLDKVEHISENVSINFNGWEKGCGEISSENDLPIFKVQGVHGL